MKKDQTYSTREFGKKYLKDAYHFDTRIFRTLGKLVFKPGFLSSVYFTERHEKYVQPLKLYFIINFIFFLFSPLLSNANIQLFSFKMDSLMENNHFYQNIIEKQISYFDISKEIYTERFDAHIKYNQPAFIFLVIPFFALFVFLFNLRRKKFIEHLVYSTHFLSFFLIFVLSCTTLFGLLYVLLDGFPLLGEIIAIFFVVLLLTSWLLYLYISIRVYYGNNKWQSALKALLLCAAFFCTIACYIHFLFFNTIFALRLGY